MDVYVYQTVPFRVNNAKTLLNKIESAGEEVSSINSGTNGIPVPGAYFIAGERKSIVKVLKATPDGSFIGQSLAAMMTQPTANTKTIIVAIVPSRLSHIVMGGNPAAWVNINRDRTPSNTVRFREILAGIRPASAGPGDDVELDL